MKTIYLDWNVFSLLFNREKIQNTEDKETFDNLYNVIQGLKKELIIPFSNAHLQDLYKSYKKGERERVDTSLEFIKELTNSVCITQYWDQTSARFHQRDPFEFFNSLKEEEDNSFNSFDDVLNTLKEVGADKLFDVYKELPHNMNFEQIKEQNPFFASLFPRSQKENNMYAVMFDMFDLISSVRQNPVIYSELRKLFKNGLQIDPNISNYENTIEQLDTYLPKTMLNKSFTELYSENNKRNYSKNIDYELITGLYMQLDFVGYHSDKINEKNTYENLFNDALHCFYAAHSNVYLTNDKRNYKKTKAVFENQNISTLIMTPTEFIDYLLDRKH